jgi:pimeloyl-ACP methyl ester carboxylesterase
MLLPQGKEWPAAAMHPPILLIHGLGCSVRVWEPALRCFAAMGLNRPVYAMDMPGYGRSQNPDQVLGIAELADWTTRLLDVLGIPRVHIAGNSMGCQVALALARRHPERVGGLVLTGGTEGGDQVPFWRTMLGLFLDGLHEPILYNGTLIRMYVEMGALRYFATVRKMLEDTPLDSAGEVAAPTLIIRGSRDDIIPERIARQFAARLPQGSFMEIRHAPHAVQFVAPDQFTKMAVAFWERAESRLFGNQPRSFQAMHVCRTYGRYERCGKLSPTAGDAVPSAAGG